jgi:hypothetical protein
MHMSRHALLLVLAAAASSCMGTGGATPASDPLPDAGPTATFQPGLQYDGSVAFARSASSSAGSLRPASAVIGHVEISAPIIPDVSVLYAQEGAAFPTSQADEEILADAAALDFAGLLVECATYSDYSAIVLAGPSDPPLTTAQLESNYELVAECSYVRHTAKPYWIPKIVTDVDVCARTLGADWRILAESDLASFTTADYQTLADTLAGASGGGFGAFYFSLDTFALGTNGDLAHAHLDPGASVRVEPLSVSPTSTFHLEAGLGLRCIRSIP